MKCLFLVAALLVGIASQAAAQFVNSTPISLGLGPSDSPVFAGFLISGELTPSSQPRSGLASALGPGFIDGATVAINSHTATNVLGGEKINALGAYNRFGGATNGAGDAGEGSRTGVFAAVEQSGPVAFTSAAYGYVSGIFAYITVPQGNSTVGQDLSYTGVAGLAEVGGTTRVFNLYGAEFDVAAKTGTVVGNRVGVVAISGSGIFPSQVRGTYFDGVYAIGSEAGGEWDRGYVLGAPNGVWPFTSGATLIGTYANMTGPAGTGIDFTGVTTFAYNQWQSGNPSTGVGGWVADSTGHYTQHNVYPYLRLRDSAVLVDGGGLISWQSFGSGNWGYLINTAAGGDFSTFINPFSMSAGGTITIPALAATGANLTTPTITTPAISGGTVINLPTPTSAGDAVPKSYADSIAAGVVTHAAVTAATTGNLTATASGTGPGKTLTNSGAQAAFSIDGVSPSVDSRILVKDQTLSQNNGIYTLTTVGSGSVNWVLTRATDLDAAAPSEVVAGASTIVINGTANAATQWVETGQGPFTLETTPIVFSKVTSGGGSGTVNNGTISQLGYYAATGTTVSGLPTANNGTLITSAGGVPSISSTLPNAVQDLITRLGTITVGVWSGTSIGLSKGGTNADLSATGGTSQVLKQTTLGGNVSVSTLTPSDLTPTATNDNAAAGKLGEYITGSATAVALTSTTQTNITTVSLSAGDWDVTASVQLNPAATTTSTVRAAGVTTTSATMPTTLAVATAASRVTGAITAGQGRHVLNTAPARQSLAGTTTVYCVAQVTFATSTMTADCLLRARRVR